jgi:hypothetical protein
MPGFAGILAAKRKRIKYSLFDDLSVSTRAIFTPLAFESNGLAHKESFRFLSQTARRISLKERRPMKQIRFTSRLRISIMTQYWNGRLMLESIPPLAPNSAIHHSLLLNALEELVLDDN